MRIKERGYYTAFLSRKAIRNGYKYSTFNWKEFIHDLSQQRESLDKWLAHTNGKKYRKKPYQPPIIDPYTPSNEISSLPPGLKHTKETAASSSNLSINEKYFIPTF
jgi:hypothetical protein